MNNGLMLDVGQANELKMAFRRAGWTNEEIKYLSEGDNLKEVKKFLFRKKFPVWKTINLGIGPRNIHEFFAALEKKLCVFSKYDIDVIKKSLIVSPNRTEIDLVKVPLANLGFRGIAQLKNIYERAASFGLEPLSAEELLQLRLQCLHETKCGNIDFIFVSMETKDGFFCVHFGYDRGIPWIDVLSDNASVSWSSEAVFVFAIPKQS